MYHYVCSEGQVGDNSWVNARLQWHSQTIAGATVGCHPNFAWSYLLLKIQLQPYKKQDFKNRVIERLRATISLVPFSMKFSSTVCQNLPKLCRPTWVMWNDVPVLFFSLKPRRKDLTNRHESLPPPPSPSVPPNDVKRILAGFCRVAQGVHISCIQILHFFRTVGLFVKSFLPALKKQHRNIFSHYTGQLVKFGWILTYLKISLEMRLLPRAFQLKGSGCFLRYCTNCTFAIDETDGQWQLMCASYRLRVWGSYRENISLQVLSVQTEPYATLLRTVQEGQRADILSVGFRAISVNKRSITWLLVPERQQ